MTPAERRQMMLQGAHVVHEIVAGRTIALPRHWQGLAAQENLFHDEIGEPGWRQRRTAGTERCQTLAQPAAVDGRVEQTVDVINAQAID